MAGLQRSVTSFRRQGSSGSVWDDRFLSAELIKLSNEEEGQLQGQQQQERNDQGHEKVRSHRMKEIKTQKTVGSTRTMERSRSSEGGRGFGAGKVLSPGIDEPPSPKLSACGFWRIFGKKGDQAGRKKTAGERRRR